MKLNDLLQSISDDLKGEEKRGLQQLIELIDSYLYHKPFTIIIASKLMKLKFKIMKKRIISLVSVLFISGSIFAQEGRVGINATSPKSTLDVSGKTDGSGNPLTTDVAGLQAPRLTRAELTAKGNVLYGTDQKGALIYITDITGGDTASQRMNVTATGYYYFDGNVWQKIGVGDAGTPSPYESIRGNAVTITTGSYTVSPSDYLIVTNFNNTVTITFPALTNTIADIGRMVHVFNNNTVPGGLSYVGVTGSNLTTNQGRGRIFVWTGTTWVNIGI